MDIDTIIDSP